jgi:general secretion pathway protein A
MYERFYGLSDRPFDLTANPKFLFLSSKHEEALSVLLYALRAQKGVTLLIGEAGTGKSTLLRAALEAGRVPECRAVYLHNPSLSRNEFFEWLTAAIGLPREAATSKPKFLELFEAALRDRQHQGLASAIVIDEAQSLPDELLEELRLLANLETATRKLVSLVLTGQPELAVRLNQPHLRQLKQRVALRCVLAPLTREETFEYIATRLSVVGGDRDAIFTREALSMVFDRSAGIPRTISVICDNALLNGFALGRKPVDAAVVREASHDLDLDDRPAAIDLPAEMPPHVVVPPVPVPESAVEVPPAAAAWAPSTLFAHFSQRRRFSFFSPRVEP